MLKLHCGDSLEVLKTYPDNSVDSVVTDPPYGLSFMGKTWDYDVPDVALWKECLRVLKPGGHLLAFGGTRTYHRLVVAIEDAGFEIRDQIQWIYGQGFPKSQNIALAIDKQMGVESVAVGENPSSRPNSKVKGNRGFDAALGEGESAGVQMLKEAASAEAQKWSGWGTALKPANEPICLARKPLSESTIAKNVLKHGTGGLNIDGTRIATTDRWERKASSADSKVMVGKTKDLSNRSDIMYRQKTEASMPEGGRFPSNVILDETLEPVLIYMGTSGSIDRAIRSFFNDYEDLPALQREFQSLPIDAHGERAQERALGNIRRTPTAPLLIRASDLPEVWSKYFKLSGLEVRDRKCASALLDEQSGISSSKAASRGERHGTVYGGGKGPTGPDTVRGHSDSGGASRFFYVAKASKSDRGEGNTHPTVKPIKLMEYLIKLVTPEGGKVLDPFMGSGTTGVAAENLGFDFVGIELLPEHFEICKKRMNYDEFEKFFADIII